MASAYDDLIPNAPAVSGNTAPPVSGNAYTDLVPTRPQHGLMTTATGQNVFMPTTNADVSAKMEYGLQHPETLDPVDRVVLPWIAPAIRAMDAIPDMPTMVAKGTRDMVTGLTSLPFDLMGSPKGEAIRKAIPQIGRTTRGENIGSAVVQYGLPATSAFKLGGAALEKLPTLARWLGTILLAGTADAAATDPEQAATIGDFIGGPTKIDQGDSPMVKRAKVGAESLVTVPLATGAAKAVGYGAKGLKNVYDFWLKPSTTAGQREMVGKLLSEAGVTPDTLDQAMGFTGDGYKATVGATTNTGKALSLEKSVATEPAYVDRVRANEKAISEGVGKTLDSSAGAQPAATQQFFASQRQGMENAADAQTAATQRNLATAQVDLADAQRAVEANAGGKPQAAQDFWSAYMARKNADQATKAGNYGAATQLGQDTLVDPRDLANVAATVRNQIGPLVEQDRSLNAILGDLNRLAPPDAAPVPTGLVDANGVPITRPAPTQDVTLADLIDLKPRLSKAIDNAQANYSGGVVTSLRNLSAAIDQRIARLLEAGAPGAEQLRNAETFFRENFAPKYREGVGGAIDQAARNGAPVPETAVAGKFLKPNSAQGATEAVQQIQYLLQQPNGAAAARRYLVSSMADTMVNGRVEPARLQKWMTDNSIAIDAVPGARQEIQQMANRVATRSNTVGRLEQELAAAQQNRQELDAAYKDDPTRFWIGADPESAVTAVLDGKNAAGDLTQLMAAARKDPTGAATEGLKNTIKRVLNQRLRNAGKTVKGDNLVDAVAPEDLKVSLTNMNKLLLEGSPERRALQQVFSPDEVKSLDLYRKRLELLTRINEKGTAGSDTMSLITAGNGVDGLSQFVNLLQGNIQGNAVTRFIKFIRQTVTGNPGPEIRKLLTDAMLDPELSRTLLAEYTPNSAPVIEKKLRTYLTGNVLSEVGARRDNTP